MSLENVYSDILFSINQFLNPVDRFFLRQVCSKFRTIDSTQSGNYFSVETTAIPTIELLIQYGYLDIIIKYKVLVSRPPTIEWMHVAAQYGHLNISKYLREKGCPWDEWTCYFAAYKGHLHILQWARSQGCPWNREYCLYSNNQEIKDWVIANS